jgi:hypothetical protein
MAALAQNSTKSRPENVVTKLVRLQHADPHKVRDLLTGAGASASWDDALHVLVISGSPSDVASLEQTAKELDAASAQAPSSNVEMTVYVIGASNDPAEAGQIPQELQSTVEQLKSLFSYSAFQLLETILTRGRIGAPSTAQGTLQLFKGEADTFPPNYDFSYAVGGISSSAPPVIHVNNFFFSTRFAVKTSKAAATTPTQFRTYLDIPAGKKVVVGKAGAGGDHAIFLVVEAAVAK